jgi:hypothetical protein
LRHKVADGKIWWENSAMKKFSIIILCILFIVVVVAAAAQKTPDAAAQPTSSSPASALKDDKEKISYALGMRLALELKDLRKRSVDFDLNLVEQGIRDSVSGKTLMTEDQRIEVLGKLQKDLVAKEEVKRQEKFAANRTAGAAFLAANKTKRGRGDVAQRIAVQNPEGGHWAEAGPGRYRGLQLSRHIY